MSSHLSYEINFSFLSRICMNYQKCTKCVAHDNADKPVFINDEELSLGRKTEILKS